jgi:hypothetical protein
MLEDLYPELNMASVPRIAGVPRFACRQGLQQGWKYLKSRRSDALSALVEEVRLLQYLGLFIECWRRRKRVPVRRNPAAKAATAAMLAVWLQFNDGLVTLIAKGATLQEILAEWSRIGGTRVDSTLTAPVGPFDIELTNVPETQALQVLFRDANVVVVGRSEQAPVRPAAARASWIERILLAPATSNAASSNTPPAFAPIPANRSNPVNSGNAANLSNQVNPSSVVQPILGRDGRPIPDDQQ